MLRYGLLFLCLLTGEVQATDLRLLNEPGHALLLRHALAPGVGDPAGFVLDNCSTQRNLSAKGRQQARDIGERLRAVVGDQTDPRVVIRSDAGLKFGDVRRAMLAIEDAGFRGVGLIADSPAGATGGE